jgi:hypothetical protein
MFWFLILSPVLGDNIEIAREDFEVLKIGSTYINSNDRGPNEPWNSLKISFIGIFRYELRSYGEGKYELVDFTRYIADPAPMSYRIDYEQKHNGMIKDVWHIVEIVAAFVIIVLDFPMEKLDRLINP